MDAIHTIIFFKLKIYPGVFSFTGKPIYLDTPFYNGFRNILAFFYEKFRSKLLALIWIIQNHAIMTMYI